MGKRNPKSISFIPKLSPGLNKPVSRIKSSVVSRHFDNGSMLNIQMSRMESSEYEVPGSRAEFSEPCITLSKGSSFGIELGDDISIESFDKPGKLQNPVQQDPVQNKKSPEDNKQEDKDPDKNSKAGENSAKKDIEPAPDKELKKENGQKSGEVNEKDDFISDLEAILRGQKKFDNEKKEIVETKSAKEKTKENQSDGNPFKESEHAIFDKIKENMVYANAYDLGEIQVQKMFREFDKKFEDEDSVKAVNTVKNPVISESLKATSLDFIQDMDSILNTGNKPEALSSYADTIPLDPGIGGQSIGMDALQPGDIIISTTKQFISRAIKAATGSEVSHSSVYVGDGNVIEAVADGVLLRSLDTALSDATLAVAYRHIHITPDKAQRMLNFLTEMKDQNRKYDLWGVVKIAPHQVLNTYIKKLPAPLQEKLKNNIGGVKLGTDANNEFFCSELVFDALKDAGLSICNVDVTFKTPEDIVKLNHNGTLQYIGHLKS